MWKTIFLHFTTLLGSGTCFFSLLPRTYINFAVSICCHFHLYTNKEQKATARTQTHNEWATLDGNIWWCVWWCAANAELCKSNKPIFFLNYYIFSAWVAAAARSWHKFNLIHSLFRNKLVLFALMCVVNIVLVLLSFFGGCINWF